MRNFDGSSCFYNEVLKLFGLNDYESTIPIIKTNIPILKDQGDIALAYMICGFINYRLGDYCSSINDFSKSINCEAKIDILNRRSKDISLHGRSNSRYKNGDYQGSIEDKIKAKNIRKLENQKISRIQNILLDYKDILSGSFSNLERDPKYITLISVAKPKKNKYDLIEDYKKVINNEKREEVIRRLEALSQSKYIKGDFKGSIKAIRRAEKYY